MIYDFINDICAILDITAPSVSFDTSNFSTDTMMAQVEGVPDSVKAKIYERMEYLKAIL